MASQKTPASADWIKDPGIALTTFLTAGDHPRCTVPCRGADHDPPLLTLRPVAITFLAPDATAHTVTFETGSIGMRACMAKRC